MSNLMFVLVVLAVLIIVVLVGVAVYYHVLLHKKQVQQKASEKELRSVLEQRNARNITSIELIAKAVLQEQVSLTEASIRINSISQSLNLKDDIRESLIVFRQLAEATSHIPILEEWKALPKKQKQDFDLQREEIEEKFKDFVLEAARKISEETLLGKSAFKE